MKKSYFLLIFSFVLLTVMGELVFGMDLPPDEKDKKSKTERTKKSRTARGADSAQVAANRRTLVAKTYGVGEGLPFEIQTEICQSFPVVTTMKKILENEENFFKKVCNTNLIVAMPLQGLVVIARGDKCRFFDIETAQKTPLFYTTNSTISYIACSPNEKLLAVGSISGTVGLVDMSLKTVRFNLHLELPVRYMTFSPDNKQIAIIADRPRSFDVKTSTVMTEFNEAANTMTYKPKQVSKNIFGKKSMVFEPVTSDAIDVPNAGPVAQRFCDNKIKFIQDGIAWLKWRVLPQHVAFMEMVRNKMGIVLEVQQESVDDEIFQSIHPAVRELLMVTVTEEAKPKTKKEKIINKVTETFSTKKRDDQ